jgi:hypothetical protein
MSMTEPTHSPTAADLYARVPTIRRNGPMSAALFLALVLGFIVPMALPFVLAGLPPLVTAILVLIPTGLAAALLIAVCVVVLTGPVYMAELQPKDNSNLKTWGFLNKVVAVLLLGGYVYYAFRVVVAVFTT